MATIKKKDIGLKLPGQINGLGTIASFADHLHVGFGLQQPSQAIAEYWVIICYENAD